MDDSLKAGIDRMRDDWNRRALADARYFVAFGRLNQTDDEFTQTAYDTGVIGRILRDLPWLPGDDPRARRLLEIGCGLGRLMRPLSRECGEIHGVDISDEMIARAREWLAGIPHAHVHVAANDLGAFASASFDFAYSYAVFQHIPEPRFVYRYLDEALRVLKPGGVLAAQLNSLKVSPNPPDTWAGCSVPAEDVASYAREAGWQLLSLEGAGSMNLWFTLRKPDRDAAEPALAIAHVMRSNSDEKTVPAGGPSGFAAVYVAGLPPETCDIHQLGVRIADVDADITYIGPERPDGLRQLNARVPECTPPGRAFVEVLWRGRPVSPRAPIEIIPRDPLRPRIVALTDGCEVILDHVIRSRWMQISTLDCPGIERLRLTVDGHELACSYSVCVDPLPPRHMSNWRIPEAVPPGRRTVRVRLGDFEFPPEIIELEKGTA